MRIISKTLLYYVIALIGILLFSALPRLFQSTNETLFNFSKFMDTIIKLLGALFRPEEWVYSYKMQQTPILQDMWNPYIYSMTIFLSACVLAFVLAIIVSFNTMLLPKKLKKMVLSFVLIVESIPDLVIAFSSVLFIVFLYKKTGILFFEFASLGKGEQIYALPILALTVLPLVYFIKVIILSIEDELKKNYVELARGKGLGVQFILAVHVFRNIAPSLFYQSKAIIWFTLSNLLVLEVLFNINGIITFLQRTPVPMVTFFVMVFVFTPFYFFYSIIEELIKHNEDDEEDSIWKKVKNEAILKLVKKVFYRTWRLFHPILIQFKNIKFVIGFVIFAGFLSASFYHYIVLESEIPQTTLLYGEHNVLLSDSPHPPSKKHWLGTDREGFDLFYKVIDGAKYTLLFAVLIALLRVIISIFLAYPYAFFVKGRMKSSLSKFVDGYHFIPISLMAYILLEPVLYEPPSGFSTTFSERVILEVVILTILAVPVVSILIGNEMKTILKEEYITSTKLLGANRFHVFFKHIRLQLTPKLGIIFGQQVMQVLLVFAHLGLFNLFFGGTDVCYGPMCDPPKSLSNEWSGLVGNAKNELLLAKWIMAAPLGAFMLTTIAVNLMIVGMQETMNKKHIRKAPRFIHRIREMKAFKVVSRNKRIAAIILVSITIVSIASGYELLTKTKQASQTTSSKVESEEVDVVQEPFYPNPIDSKSKANYDLSIKMDENSLFTVNAKVEVENKSEYKWNELLFYFMPNLYTKDNLKKLSDNREISVQDGIEVTLNDVMVDGKSVDYSLELHQLTIPLQKGVSPSETNTVEFSYTFTVPRGYDGFSQMNGNYYLEKFYPILAFYDEDWIFNDNQVSMSTLYTGVSNFKVKYEIPKAFDFYKVISSSNQDPDLEKTGELVGEVEVHNSKEFFMAFVDLTKTLTEEVSGVQLRVMGSYMLKRNDLEKVKTAVEEALQFYTTHIGDFPYGQLDIMIGRQASYPGVMMMSTTKQQKFLNQALAYELSSQWFGHRVMHHINSDVWLDKGISHLLAGVYLMNGKNMSESEAFFYEEGDEWKTGKYSNVPETEFDRRNQFFVIRRQSALSLWEYFVENGGADEALAFLKAYYNTYENKYVTTNEFVNYFNDYYELKENEVFEAWIEF